jgi:hypothetical protein
MTHFSPGLVSRTGCIGLALSGLVWAGAGLGPAVAQSGFGTAGAGSPSQAATGGTGATVAEADPPVHVMSDTPEFCVHLSSVLSRAQQTAAAMPPVAPATAAGSSSNASATQSEVQVLAVAGRRMCADGHVRAGIQRLRRALMILHGNG